MSDKFDVFLSGKELYGDDFSLEQLVTWYAEEEDGYANLVTKRRGDYRYVYHQMNIFYGYRHIKLPLGAKILGIGSAYCDEFIPIVDRASEITALEPSEKFLARKLENVPIKYVKPRVTGEIPFENDSFDLITSFGVLHHIANVSFVLSECHRCLKKGGVMLLREPIVSMGDWRQPRRGLTKNERGIPFDVLKELTARSGFSIERMSLLDFPPFVRLMSILNRRVYLSKFLTFIDFALAKLFTVNKKYHRTGFFDRFGPAATYMILKKQ